MNKPLRTTLIIIMLIAFISTISYCSAPYDTETAHAITIRKTINGNGLILRKETPVNQSANGVFEASVEEGSRVSRGGNLGVCISGNLNSALTKELSEVTARIEDIEQAESFADLYSSDEARIYSALKEISRSIRTKAEQGDYCSATEELDRLNAVIGKKYDIESQNAQDQLLISLQERKYEIEQQLGGIRENVHAPASGYFYKTVDGLEQVGNEREIAALTSEDIKELSESLSKHTPDKTQVGKIVDTYNWYLVASVTEKDAQNLTEGKEVSLSIDDSPSVSATVLAVNIAEKGDSAVIIKCNRDVSGIFEKRRAEFEICYEEYNGLYVPAAAIRVVDDVTGVYVISRNATVSFRAAHILLHEEDFYIAQNGYKVPEGSKYSALKLYDDILVNPEVVRLNEPEKES
ncbi:MAG: hypothetical protein IJZ81_01610 [Clostridia bacterium]|nr:hypothetical protein [Clostridia bacterium]